ncbi:hypothetical protein OG257_36995 [Streptomyces sp. NBC_00683]|uniref:hypothetical protein n=1 Tax=Streptomyces sp. NBC_00683 TaxID=2903670 RepID=UPI002E31ED74|nr:hypothetical protein [Streptomyces sp. NBC_00683]
MHLVAPLRDVFEANVSWLTVFQLPTYAPEMLQYRPEVINGCLAGTGLTLSA